MSDNRLVVHHVGGRAGSRDFPVLPAFEGGIINVMYDADESCLPQIMSAWSTYPSKTIVLPYCLAAQDGACKFHINYDPYTSSAYPLNPRYAQFYYIFNNNNKNQRYDYVFGDTVRTMEEIQLPTTTLDAVVLERGEVPGPDFISIDTQGSELNILAGASRLLSETILAVSAEVELHPFYEGQPLFGDICQFLAKYNFDLVDIRLFQKLLPMRGKHGFRGEGYAAHGEALFLKRPENVVTSLQLNKLAFIATIFGQFECAQQCFETTGFEVMVPLQSEVSDQQPRYLDFISRLAHAVTLLPQRSAPLFSSIYSYTQSRARFQWVPEPPASELRKFLKSIPYLVSAVRGLRGLLGLRGLRGLRRGLRRRLRTLSRSSMSHVRWWLRRPGSAVEAIFLEFGMQKQFLLAMKNRIEDSER